MAAPRLTYNSKNIDLPKLALYKSFQVSPTVPRTVNTTLTGATEVISLPRIDVEVSASWNIETEALRLQLEAWWNWAQQGSAWTFAMDSSNVSSTTLSSAAAAGATSVVVASASGFATNDRIILRDGANYQIVKITSIVSTTINFTGETLDRALTTSCVCRHEHYWSGEIRDARRSPFVDSWVVSEDGTQSTPQFRFDLNFHEVGG